MAKPSDLPDDIESLQRLVIAQRAALLDRDLLIEKLRTELARLKRALRGSPANNSISRSRSLS